MSFQRIHIKFQKFKRKSLKRHSRISKRYYNRWRNLLSTRKTSTRSADKILNAPSRSPDNKAIYATCSANSPIGLAPDGIFHFHLEAARAKIHERGETYEKLYWYRKITVVSQTVLILVWLVTYSVVHRNNLTISRNNYYNYIRALNIIKNVCTYELLDI